MGKGNKYFVTCGDCGDFMVIYQDWCEVGGNYWATEESGFDSEAEAQDYADRLNDNI